MRLKNVKVHQNGNKGMTVTYLKTEVRDGIPYEDEFRRGIMTPVPNEIRYVLQKLGKHLGILSYLNMGTKNSSPPKRNAVSDSRMFSLSTCANTLIA